MAESEDVNTLKRRGRRRLVGAIALVFAAIIVLPMVFDSEPRGSAPPVSVRIPGEDESGFTPKVTPKTPALPEKKAIEKAPEKAPEPAVQKPEPKIEAKVAKAVDNPAAERAKSEAALAAP